jgi:alkylation response protein AidB-like acyl-CoA dehydrogenase
MAEAVAEPATTFALSPSTVVAQRPEVASLIEATDAWLKDHSGPQQFRRLRGDVSSDGARSLLRGLDALGMANAFVPERYGGSGLPLGLAPLLTERFGWNLAREPMIENCLLPSALLRCLPSNERTAALLGTLSEGGSLAVAFQEGPFAFDAAARLHTVVRRSGNRVQLTGEKRHVMGAVAADRVLVLAASDAGPCFVAVPAQTSGVTREDNVVADGSCWSTLRFDVTLQPDAIVEDTGAAADALSNAIDWTNVAVAGLLYGLQSRMLQMTLEFLRTREQFDAPIGSFQALQHRATDLYCANQITRFLISEAVDTLGAADDDRAPTLAPLASRCKARAADSTLAIGKEAIQMHGAIGFSDEYDLGMYVNRSLVLAAWLGNGAAHRRRYASLRQPLAE